MATIARAQRGPDGRPITPARSKPRGLGHILYFGARVVALVALLALLALSTDAFAVTINWNDPAADDWFDATNWDDPALNDIVPTNADEVFVNNGGEAQAAGADAETRSLFVGALVTGTATTDALAGTVTADGVDVTSVFGTIIGLATTDAPSANGTLTTLNGGSSLNPGTGFFTGVVSASTNAAASATGNATIDGELLAAFGTIGGVLNSGANTANGTVIVDGDATGDFTIGTVVLSPGGDATGSLTVVNGDYFNRGSNITVGNTLDGGTADGTVVVQNGAFKTLDSVFNGTLNVGTSSGFGAVSGGDATGSFTAASTDTSLNEIRSVLIGQSATGGSVIGDANFGTGTLNVLEDVRVGFTGLRLGNGSSDGSLVTEGTVAGSGPGNFDVGKAFGFGILDAGNGTANGTATVTGIQEFRFFDIGVIRGVVQNDVDATGELHVGTGGIQGAPTLINGNGNEVTSNSSLVIGGTIGTPNNNQVQGTGGTSSGTATVTGGNISGLSGTLSVGRAEFFGTAEGMLTVTDGDINADSIQVGFTRFFQPENIADPLIATKPDATGTLIQENGALTLPDGSAFGLNSSFQIGVSLSDGQAKGTVDLSNVDVIGDTLQIGLALFAETENQAEGSLTMGGGSLQVRSVAIATASTNAAAATGKLQTSDTTITIAEGMSIGSGPGDGEVIIEGSSLTVGETLTLHPFQTFNPGSALLQMTNSFLDVGNILVGTIDLDSGPPSNASSIVLVDTDAVVGTSFFLGLQSNAGILFGESLLSLTRSLVDVGTVMHFQKGSDVQFVINGLTRGSEYGAINAESAILGNPFESGLDPISTGGSQLFVDFDPTFFGPLFNLPEVIFDLIITELTDGIELDFSSVTFSDVPNGYEATSGIVTDLVDGNTVEIYRVTLSQVVAEPATLGMLGIGLAGAALLRRRRRHA